MKIFAFMFALVFPLLIQAQDAKELIRTYFQEVRQGKFPPIPQHLSLPENGITTLKELNKYHKDTAAAVRSKACAVAKFVGTKSRQTPIRQQAVSQLVDACQDKNAGNVGTALNYLTEFTKEDFTIGSLNSIRSLFNTKPLHFERLLKLMGFLELKDLTESIRPYTQPGNSQPLRWAAILSLSRMGDGNAIGEMMRRATKLPVTDDVVYEVCPALVYSRQKIALDYLIEILHSDASNCTSANNEKEIPILCGYRIMEQLAPAIDGYPLVLDESGDLKTDNYEAALQTVRLWFKDNTNYVINKNRY